MQNKVESRYTVLKRPPLHSTHWTGGFWQKQFELCTNTILPNIFSLFDSDEISHCIANFRIAAGTQEGTHKGPPFGDGDFYKWLEAASYIYGVTKDEKLKKRIDESIKLIASVQREDGYIFTQYSIKLKQGAKEEKLGNSLNFEAYNLGHLITAACIHARTTGERTLLDLGIKAAHCLKALFEEAKKTHTAKTAICPSHYMALIDLYRLTGDITHLDTAELAIRLRDEVVGGTDDNQDRLKLADHTEMLGHAVRATYLYSGVADLVAEIGDKEYSEILMKVWESEEYTKMYINSGCGALFDGVSPSGFAGDHPNLARTHQAFGRPYQLPNLTGYNETCASIGNIFFNWRLLHLNAQAVHADRIEQSFYNLVLASVSRDGLRYFYSNPLAREEKQLPFHLKWERTRSEFLSSFCCPPNMLRVLAQSSEYAYSLAEDGIYTVMYGQSRASLQVGSNHVVLEQHTAYPFDGSITITVVETDGTPFTLYVRIPSWVKQGRIQNHTIMAEQVNSYLPLRSDWKQGDLITIEFAMEPRILLAHPMIEECTHQVAVMRGPLVYCSEQVDHPKTNWASLGLRQNARFTTVTRTIGGESMLCLQTHDGVAYQSLNWDDHSLYQEATDLIAEPTTLSLIPYYAWDNRGLGGMKIWHPLYLS